MYVYIGIMSSDNQAPISFHLRDEEYKEQIWGRMRQYQLDKFKTYYHAHNQKHGCDVCGGRYVTSKRAEHVKLRSTSTPDYYIRDEPNLRKTACRFLMTDVLMYVCTDGWMDGWMWMDACAYLMRGASR